MCNTWYLSMPVGTIFAFRVNAQATLAHLHDHDHDAELDEELSAEDAEGKTMVGYVRDVSPNGLDIGLLVSEAHAYDESASIDPLHPAIRKGLAVHTTNGPASNSGSNSARPRRNTHPLFNSSSSNNPLFDNASSRNPFSSITALPVLQPRSQFHMQGRSKGGSKSEEGLLAALATHAPSLHPTAALPTSWGRAFAYRPNIAKPTKTTRSTRKTHTHTRNSMHLGGRDDTGALRVPLGARHRLVVGKYSAEGLAARPQTRFSRREVARAECVMDGLREEEEERRREQMRESSTSSSSSSSSEPTSEGTNSPSRGFGDMMDDSVSDSEGSFSSVDLDEDSKPSKPSQAGDASTHTHASPLPIVIDIILDLESVRTLPASPEDFERAVARLERIERSVQRKTGKNQQC